MTPVKGARCEHSLGPITALAFAGEFLFAGEGPFLVVSSLPCTTGSTDWTQVAVRPTGRKRWRTFDAQAIHGIVLARDSDNLITLIIYGGCYVRAAVIYKRPCNAGEVRFGKIQTCSDWILDLSVRSPTAEPGDVAIEAIAVTAHNALLGLTFSAGADHEKSQDGSVDSFQEPLTGATKCMLYAASVHWLTTHVALVISGTAFGEIIVWTCQIGALSAIGVDRLQVHYSFSAHDGSVFGLDAHFSAYRSNGEPARALVASCSDDRTIRVWDISPALPSADEATTSLETTAFCKSSSSDLVIGRTSRETESLIKQPPECFAKLWAHSSRIWHVKFASSLDLANRESDVTVFSFGEDATRQIWNLKIADTVDQDSPNQFQNIEVLFGHSGKNIWSFSIIEQTPGAFMVATGGADGRIVIGKVCTLDVLREDKPCAIEEIIGIPWDPSAGQVPLDAAHLDQRKDGYKTYCFIGSDTLLMTSQRGHIMRASFSGYRTTERYTKNCASGMATAVSESLNNARPSASGFTAESISESQDLASYSIMVGEPSLRVAFIGGANGQILLYNDHSRTLESWNKLDRKIAGLFLSRPSIHNEGGLILLATEMGTRIATFFFFTGTQEQSREKLTASSAVRKTKLDLPEGFVVTSIAYSGNPHHIILLGSRDGRIIRFSITFADSDEQMLSKFEYIGRHSDAVTCILLYFPTHDRCQALSTGRDSTYAIHDMPATMSGFVAVRIHSLTLPFGPNVEGAYLCKSGQLRFHGFHSKDFVEYSETDLAETVRIECGGAHRVWSYQPMEITEGRPSRLIWTKAAKLCSSTHQTPKCVLVKHGGHGREIKSCARRPQTAEVDGYESLLATGAEDTDIRLFKYAPGDEASLRCVSVMRKHNTGIQQLQWSDDGHFLFSCGGCEEFFVWRVRDEAGKAGFVEVQVVCEATLPPASELPDLRIMSFSVQQHNEALNGSFQIVMAFSDSTLRTYSYTPNTASFKLLGTGVYKTCCLTQARFLPFAFDLAVIGATDGSISIWSTQDDSGNMSCLHTTRVHQNAVKDLDFIRTTPDRSSDSSNHLIFSVGDDNAVAVTRLNIDRGNPYTVSMSSLIIPRAHVAAATAMTVVSVKRSNENLTARIATLGNDQRLKCWEFSCDSTCPGVTGIGVKKLSNDAVAVADVSCMVNFDDALTSGGGSLAPWSPSRGGNRLIVCGVGMQVFSFE